MLVSAFHHLLQTFMNAHEPSSPSRKSVQTLLPLPVPLFSLCLCYMPHCLLFYSRWMLPPQLFVCFCSFYLCDSLQILLNTCLCNSSFSLQNSSSTDVLLISVAHHSAPLSTYLSLCCTLLCVSSLICAVKNPALLFILIIVERGESYGEMWW